MKEKKIKKSSKLKIIIISLIFAIPLILNKLIFILSNKNDDEEGEIYKWHKGDIFYTVKGEGKPILFIHQTNIGSSHKEWIKNIDELSKYYKVYAIDLLGYGKSAKVAISYTTYTYTLLINSFIKDVIKKPTAVIASSSSAAAAVMAAKYEKGNIKRLILIEPTGIEDNYTTTEDCKILKLLETPFIGTCIYNYFASKTKIKKFLENDAIFSKELISKELINTYYIEAHRGGANSRYTFASNTAKFMNINIKEAIKDLNIPIYIIWGEETKINPILNMEILENIRPDIFYAIFESTRLLPQYENSTEFNKLVREFLK